MLAWIYWRIYNNFLMPPRIPELARIYMQLLERGYRFLPLIDALNCQGRLPRKFVFLRHDVDTDMRTAREMFELEKKLDIRSSYYFRLRGSDIGLMREISEYGGEVGYHYEEIATFAKEHGIKCKTDIEPYLPRIAECFCMNINALRAKTGLPLKTTSSHGDFVNREMGLNNKALLEVPDLREKAGVVLEAYDKIVEGNIQGRFCDRPSPCLWHPASPLTVPVPERMLLLLHPRQWRSRIVENFKADFIRVVESIKYRLHAYQRTAGGTTIR